MNKTITNEQIIVALLTSNTRLEAAEKLEISKDTLYKRMKNDVFKIDYRRAKDMIVADAVTMLQTRMNEAINTIADIMNDDHNAPQIRINAAEDILKYSIKLTETTELINRIEALEKGQHYYN